MTLRTLWRFLFLRDWKSIEEIAGCRNAVWLGLLFVLSAGFAREYDGEDLMHEPWHLLLPLGASFATATLLYGLVWLTARGWRTLTVPVPTLYRAFLGLFWMTAPLAWLYAIPVERFLSPADAVTANLWFLGIVATWRVVLMVRVVCVLFGMKAREALPPVMLFADAVLLAVLWFTPLPLFSIMGGVRLSESEGVLLTASLYMRALGMVSAPFWLLGTVITFSMRTGEPSAVPMSAGFGRTVRRPLWYLAVGSLVIWVLVLPFTQPEQQLRRQVERDLKSGNIEEAVAVMTAHPRSDFPPHWDPPPRIGYGETQPPILDVVERILAEPTRRWVAEVYFTKLREGYLGFAGWHGWRSPAEIDEFDRYLSLLEQTPRSSHLWKTQESVLRELSGGGAGGDGKQKARIDRMLSPKATD